jgi:PHD/YefM family antitoxin component YafN of YafNO toxin-antitoxin module
MMRIFSTVDLLRDLKTVTHVAAREPVAITQHRKVRFVMMAIEDYEQLAAAKDPRRAILTAETPSDIADVFEPALDQLIAVDAPDIG